MMHTCQPPRLPRLPLTFRIRKVSAFSRCNRFREQPIERIRNPLWNRLKGFPRKALHNLNHICISCVGQIGQDTMRARLLGELEQAVLLTIMRLGSEAYGVTIRHDLMERLGRPVSIGATYTVLERLEVKGFVTSWMGGATRERGGRAKRFYRIEASGLHALDEARMATANLWGGLPGGALA
jgi:PadR family transcriptional regulator PadR